MSYLDAPRLHFFGTVSANPSTINNTPANYNSRVTQPAEAWNPNGAHQWQFLNCTVQSAVDSHGPVTHDPIIGAAVQSTDQPYAAKLVDLDTDQQGVSEIWGLQENATGAYVNTTRYVYRMNPGDIEVATLIARQFDRPAAQQTITLQVQTFDGSPVGTPPPLTIPASVTTDDEGRASFAMTARNPGNPRHFIDGQV